MADPNRILPTNVPRMALDNVTNLRWAGIHRLSLEGMMLPSIPPHTNIYRQHNNSVNSTPISENYFYPDGNQENRINTVGQGLALVDNFNITNREWVGFRNYITHHQAFDGALLIYNINLTDLFDFLVASREVGNVVDPGILDIATITAFGIRYCDLTETRPNIPITDVRYHLLEQEPNHVVFENQGASIRQFINYPLNEHERLFPITLGINLFAPSGARILYRGQFQGWVGGQEEQMEGARSENYATFTDCIQLPKLHQNNDRFMYAGIWRQVESELIHRMNKASAGDQDFPMSRIQIVSARKQAFGAYHYKKETRVVMKIKDPISGIGRDCNLLAPESREENCLFAALEYVAKNYTKTYKQKSKQDRFMAIDLAAKTRKYYITEYDRIRRSCGLLPGQRIELSHYHVMAAAADNYRISFRLYNKNGKQLVEMKAKNPVAFCFLIYDEDTEHIYLHVNGINRLIRDRCGLCLQYDVGLGHHCNYATIIRAVFNHREVGDPFIYKVRANDHAFRVGDVNHDDGVVYFDIEAFGDFEDGKEHKAYAFCWKHGNRKPIFAYKRSEKDPEPVDVFLQYLLDNCPGYISERRQNDADKAMEKYRLKIANGKTKDKNGKFLLPPKGPKNHQIIVMAWNGNSYDFNFVIRRVLTVQRWIKLLPVTGFMKRGNHILKMELGYNRFLFWDPVKFLNSTLHQACEDFNVNKQDSKDMFPHLMVINYESLNKWVSIDLLKKKEYYFRKDWSTLKKYEWNENKLKSKSIRSKFEDGVEVYSLYDINKYYLELDVTSMKEVVTKAWKTFAEDFEVNCFAFMTIPSMSKALFFKGNEWKQLIYRPENQHQDYIFRQSAIGGRVEMLKKVFCAKGFNLNLILESLNPEEDGKTKFSIGKNHGYKHQDFVGKSIVECDFTSLYVSTMIHFDYPVGRPERFTREEIVILNSGEGEDYTRLKGYLSINIINFLSNIWLPEAILPHREKGRLFWSLRNGIGKMYTSVEIAMAQECHYEIEYIDGLYWKEKKPIYREAIQKTYNLKERGELSGNDSQKQCGKLMGNACYGTALMKDFFEEYKVLNRKSEWQKFNEDHDIVYADYYGEDLVGVTGKKRDMKLSSIPHIGAFTLSYSKSLMFGIKKILFPEILNPLTWWDLNKFKNLMHRYSFYGDTDSMYILDTELKHIQNASWMVDGEMKPLMGNKLMQIKNEADKDGLIIAAFFTGNKEKCCVYIKKDNEIYIKITSKGVAPRDVSIYNFLKFYGSNIWEERISTIDVQGIKKFGTRDRELAYSMRSVDLKKRFGTVYSSRCQINLNGEEDEDNVCRVNKKGEYYMNNNWTVPFGHILNVNQKETIYSGQPDEIEDLDCFDSEEEEDNEEFDQLNIDQHKNTKDWLTLEENELVDFMVEDLRKEVESDETFSEDDLDVGEEDDDAVTQEETSSLASLDESDFEQEDLSESEEEEEELPVKSKPIPIPNTVPPKKRRRQVEKQFIDSSCRVDK